MFAGVLEFYFDEIKSGMEKKEDEEHDDKDEEYNEDWKFKVFLLYFILVTVLG